MGRKEQSLAKFVGRAKDAITHIMKLRRAQWECRTSSMQTQESNGQPKRSTWKSDFEKHKKVLKECVQSIKVSGDCTTLTEETKLALSELQLILERILKAKPSAQFCFATENAEASRAVKLCMSIMGYLNVRDSERGRNDRQLVAVTEHAGPLVRRKSAQAMRTVKPTLGDRQKFDQDIQSFKTILERIGKCRKSLSTVRSSEYIMKYEDELFRDINASKVVMRKMKALDIPEEATDLVEAFASVDLNSDTSPEVISAMVSDINRYARLQQA